MGWRDRDYSKDEPWTQRGAAGAIFRWPSRAAGVLILVHVGAFVLMLLIGTEPGGAAVVQNLSLSDKQAHPLAIVTHPLATRDLLSIIVTIFILWTLAARVEQQFGWRRMIALYAAGNLLAGAAFFTLARLWPPLAGAGLDSPTGAFAAWCVIAYRGMSDQMVPVFGRMHRLSRVVAVSIAIAVTLMLALRGLGTIGWAAALTAGGCAEPVIANVGGGLVRMPRRTHLRPSIPDEDGGGRLRGPDPFDVDDILAKISRNGIGSLTPRDRDRLEAARQARLRESKLV